MVLVLRCRAGEAEPRSEIDHGSAGALHEFQSC